MKNIKTIKAENGKIYDIIYWEDSTLKEMISYCVSEVKNPKRKKFGRYKFFNVKSGWFFIDEYESCEDFIQKTMAKIIEEEKYDKEISEKIEEFFK